MTRARRDPGNTITGLNGFQYLREGGKDCDHNKANDGGYRGQGLEKRLIRVRREVSADEVAAVTHSSEHVHTVGQDEAHAP